MTYALDTNIIIHYINRCSRTMANFDDEILKRTKMVIPPIVDYEVMRGFYDKPSPSKQAVYEKIRSMCPVVESDISIWEHAAYIWARLKNLASQLVMLI